jgi:hypothetical protein
MRGSSPPAFLAKPQRAQIPAAARGDARPPWPPRRGAGSAGEKRTQPRAKQAAPADVLRRRIYAPHIFEHQPVSRPQCQQRRSRFGVRRLAAAFGAATWRGAPGTDYMRSGSAPTRGRAGSRPQKARPGPRTKCVPRFVLLFDCARLRALSAPQPAAGRTPHRIESHIAREDVSAD